MKRAWIAATQDTSVFNTHSSEINPLIAHLLRRRGIDTTDDQLEFLHPDYHAGLHDPFLFDDMELAIARIEYALEKNEKITIYGDYDVDGVCGTSILYEMLTALNARCDIVINHREREGYGLQKSALEQCKNSGTTLIITNDSGITNTEEIAYAQQAGMDVILTDHHQPPDEAHIPPAYAIIHPLVHADRYPYKGLCGAGVVFKLIQGMLRTPCLRARIESLGISAEGFEKWLLDLVCIATIADCMPLLGENRALVHFGLIVLKKTRRIGVQELCKKARIDTKSISPHTIGFQIAPRLNAASRMEHGKLAFEILTTTDDGRASELALILEETNNKRRKLTEEIFKKARTLLKDQFDAGKKILVGIGSDWAAGVLGLVASRLMNEYNRSVVLVTRTPAGRIGAARSVASIHITNVFRKVEHLFLRYGGHAAAGGFAVKETVDEKTVIQDFHTIAEQQTVLPDSEKEEIIDAEIYLSDVTFESIELLLQLEPHGIGNAKPRFLIRNVEVHDIAFVGTNGTHARFVFSDGRIKRRAIGFSLAKNAAHLQVGSKVDILTELDIHEWRDIREPQLSLIYFHEV
ncbi:single-stranded-DNA-specific exonuclease RecJ [Candidatus Uhrbacteria bacterium]|nr:single-stranded-DNA-specific exonuclease RecJ [Candidatus Uhrbacteria bacterium]